MIEETTRDLIKLFREQVEENTVLSAGSIVEIAKLPAIVLNDPTLTEKKRLMRDPDRITVIDEETGQAVREIPPRWYDLRFDVNISCNSSLELVTLLEKLSRLNQAFSLLTAKNDLRERQYLWRWETPPHISTTPKGRAAGITRVPAENISGALHLAESKGLVLIEEIAEAAEEEAAE